VGEQLLLTIFDEATGRKTMAQIDSRFVIKDALPAFVKQLKLPSNGPDGKPIPYALKLKTTGEEIDLRKTFEKAGIRNAQLVVFVGSGAFKLVFESKQGKGGTVQVDPDKPWSEQIDHILKALGLPLTGPEGKILAYDLKSKATGRLMGEGESFTAAGAQSGDAFEVIGTLIDAAPVMAALQAEEPVPAPVHAFLEAAEAARLGRRPRSEVEALAPAAVAAARAARDKKKIIDAGTGLRLAGVRPAVLEWLGDGSPQVRERAAQAVSRLRLAEAAPRLSEMLDDFQVSRAAAAALATISGRSIVPRLFECLRDGAPQTRCGAVEALTRLRVRQAVPWFEFLLQDADREVRAGAIRGLGELDGFSSVPSLLPFCQDGDPGTRAAAAEALSNLGGPEVLSHLARLLSDPDAGVREAAVLAMGRAGAADQVHRLLKDPDGPVRDAAIEVLSEGRVVEAGPTLRSMFRSSDKDAGLRLKTIEAMGRLGLKEAAPDLLPLLASQDDQERWKAAEALARMGADEGRIAVVAFLSHTESSLRMLAAIACDELKISGGVARIEALLKDAEPRVRAAAALAAGGLKVAHAAPTLVSLLQDETTAVKGSAVSALQELGCADQADAIVKLLAHEQAEVRRFAVQALAAVSSPDSAPSILPLLKDPDAAVRRDAVRALAELRSFDSLRAILDSLKDPDAEVRRAAAEAACSLGDRRGAADLLSSPDPLFSLNALRRPELFRKLSELQIGEDLSCDLQEALQKFAQATGLGVSVEVGPTGRWREWQKGAVDLPAGDGWLQVLACATEGPYEILLDPDRVRVVARETAREFWTAWAKSDRLSGS
jgi:HEAT repeat protein